MKKKSVLKKILVTVAVVLLLLTGATAVYVSDYYHAAEEAITYINEPAEGVKTDTSEKGVIIFEPAEIKAGLIFYPGAKVEYTAYAPLMEKLAEKGILVVLLKMPLNIAFLGINAAKDYPARWPEVENWYIGGHSLGGVCASMFLKNHLDEYRGLLLVASYTTTDFSGSSLSCLSIYGSNDKVLNLDKYNEAKVNLPSDNREAVIQGGNHANFAWYGDQKGDGEAAIDRLTQINTAAETISSWMNKQ